MSHDSKETSPKLGGFNYLSQKDRDEMNAILRFRCEDCNKYWADYPSKLCPGCEAYREHTGHV